MARMASCDLVRRSNCCLMDCNLSVLSGVMVEIDCLTVEERCGLVDGGGRSRKSSVLVSMAIDGRVGLCLVVGGPRDWSALVVASRLPISTSR